MSYVLEGSNLKFTLCLQASPRLRFNKDGSLLAVTTNDNGIKILANSEGLRLLRTLENRPDNCMFDSTRLSVEPTKVSLPSFDVSSLIDPPLHDLQVWK